jgi:Fe-S cluster biogenesis protein NfuA/nitrite reductase/ring-hydroxylating ferredoxin subunit
MNIFSQENFNGVQEVINNGAVRNNGIARMEPVKDEVAELNEQSRHIQELIGKIDALPDTAARDMMQTCIQEILGFYGHGLEKILEVVSRGNSTAAKDIYNDLIEDSFISGLLLIHDLHPLDLKTRLYHALEKVKPYIDSHGGSVELVSLEDGVAKIRLAGSCKTCPSSASTLELGIKQAIEESCPDLMGLEVEGIMPISNHTGTGESPGKGWQVIPNVRLVENSMKFLEAGGIPLVICKVSDRLYAYRNLCPACDRSFNNGTMEDKMIACQLGHRYDVQHAGICTDDPGIHLDPFPLLEEAGTVKIAVG